MNKIDKQNFFWNIIGSGCNALSSLVFLIIITRINGSFDSGLFSYSFATACLFYAIAVYLGRPYQVTDNGNLYSDSDYIYNRLITISIMLICVLLFSICNQYNFYKILLLELLSIYKCIEAFSEALYAVIQKNNQLYKVGISLTLKSLFSYILFFLVNAISKNMYVAIITIIILNIIITYFWDYKNAKKVGLKFKHFSKKKNMNLLKNGFYTFAFSFLSLYVLNSSRYAIDRHLDNYNQMIFGIIVMPAMVMSLLSQFIIHPLLIKIKELIKNKEFKSLNKLSNLLILCLLGIGIILIIGCYFLGIPFLQILYNTNLLNFKNSFMLIIAGSIFYGCTILISYILIGMRKTFSQFLLLAICSLIATISANVLVINKGITGASFNFFVIMLLEFILYMLLLKVSIRKE